MFYIIILAWMALWSGLAIIGLGEPFFGAVHWMGMFLIGSGGLFLAMIKALFVD